VRRLSDTCPEHKYWGQDPNYTERMKASLVIALSAANFLFRASAALEPAIGTAKMNASLCELLECDGSEAAAQELRHSEEAVIVQHAYAARASEMIGVRDGISRVCDEIGVPSRTLLRLEPNCLPAWQLASDLADAHESDRATAEFVYDQLFALWRAFLRTEEGPTETWARVA
jgi:hypothetical protein